MSILLIALLLGVTYAPQCDVDRHPKRQVKSTQIDSVPIAPIEPKPIGDSIPVAPIEPQPVEDPIPVAPIETKPIDVSTSDPNSETVEPQAYPYGHIFAVGLICLHVGFLVGNFLCKKR